MDNQVGNEGRITTDGKFFRRGSERFHAKGLTYGPFSPNSEGFPFAGPGRTQKDFEIIKSTGANLLRLYDVPPGWLLDLAQDHDLKLLIDVPWTKQVCFLDVERSRQEIREIITRAAESCASHPAVLGLSVANELPPDIVRWSGPGAVAHFLDELVGLIKRICPECLCTFGNYPPTEFLQPRGIDFHCFNVYLHHPKPFENYLARLQMISEDKPLVLGETGIDSIREGERPQASILSWQIEAGFRNGLAGIVVYSFTDEWFKDGCEIEDWGFGLTNRFREPKPALERVRSVFAEAPYFPLPSAPKVSVVVASYNAESTLPACLESLCKLRYPDYEIILVDDGSADHTTQIVRRFPQVRYLKHEVNLGLSAARNTGIVSAQGEIVAFTDADCRVDEDWLYHLVQQMLKEGFIGIGGPNLLPTDDSCLAAAVMASPGGPKHVMLTDRLAEHIPGCNMAFFKWALEEVGLFDPVFRKAGDDVDICWRIQHQGFPIGFAPAALVWHYRRSRLRDYLKQQRGYGEAEAVLVRKHPDHFSGLGGAVWRGRIYSGAPMGLFFRPPQIYHGLFGSGFFQSLYASQPDSVAFFFTSLEYQSLIALPLCILSVIFKPLLPLALLALLAPVGVSIAAAWQAHLPIRKTRAWSRPLIAFLFYLQPLVRGWARYHGRFTQRPKTLSELESLDSLSLKRQRTVLDEASYWADSKLDRYGFIQCVLERLAVMDWPVKTDSGWQGFDLEVLGNRWSRLQVLTVAEAHASHRWLLRCRLRSCWTFTAKLCFFGTLAALVLFISLWGKAAWWKWSLLLSLVGLAGWFHQQNRSLKRIVAAGMDEVAKRMNMVKLSPQSETGGCPQKPANFRWWNPLRILRSRPNPPTGAS